MAMPAGKSMWQQLGLTPHNALRYYLPAAAVAYAGYALPSRVMHGEKPHTLSEEWQDAEVMRRAFMPREAAATPVPHNPFRHNRSGADVVLAGSKARWPADAAARTPKGSRAIELPERSAIAASAAPPPAQYEGAEPEVEARVEAAVSKTAAASSE